MMKPMESDNFAELLASVREGGRILRGEDFAEDLNRTVGQAVELAKGVQMVRYSFSLRTSVILEMYLPIDLTYEEAEEVGATLSRLVWERTVQKYDSLDNGPVTS